VKFVQFVASIFWGAESMAEKQDQGEKLLATNRKAFHEYFILDKLEAGIALLGTEVKSIREARINLKESYAAIKEGEAYLFNCHISPYSHGNRENHDPLRRRKLLDLGAVARVSKAGKD
jgi:SsrA-binding protein